MTKKNTKKIPMIVIGAEFSTLSGIPIYKNSFLDRDDFDLDMEAKIFLSKSEFFRDKTPSNAHKLLAQVIEKYDGVIFTQNLDGLLEKAGIPNERISHAEALLDSDDISAKIHAQKSLEVLLGPSREVSVVIYLGVQTLDGLGEILTKYQSLPSKLFGTSRLPIKISDLCVDKNIDYEVVIQHLLDTLEEYV